MSELEIKADNYRIVKNEKHQKRIVKSNRLVNSRQSFTALQQRIITLLASRISPEEDDFEEHKFHISEIIKSKRKGGQAYRDMVNSLDGLLASQIEIIKDGEKKEWRKYNIFSKASYSEETQYASLSFAPDMKAFLLHLKGNYTSYLLKNVDGFRKTYSIRIYELCKQYYPNIRERVFSIEELKVLFSIEEKYKSWGDFRKYVIVPSIDEVNKSSDIFVRYESIKEGRKASAIKFLISKNPNNKPSVFTEKANDGKVPALVPFQSKEVNKLPDWIEEKTLQKLLQKYSQPVLDFAMNKIETKKADINNPKAYLLKGLREGWFESESKKVQESAEKEKNVREKRERLKQVKERQEQLVKEFDFRRNQKIQLWIEGLSEDVIEEFIFDFEDSEDLFMKKVSERLGRGERKEMDLKKVVVWEITQSNSVTEEDLIFAQSDVKKYARLVHQHTWED